MKPMALHECAEAELRWTAIVTTDHYAFDYPRPFQLGVG